MSNSLHAFLQSIGGAFANDGECTFGSDPIDLHRLDAIDVMVPLSHYGLLQISGPDAEKFLQGQITCSAAEVSPTLSSPGAYCTAKGRVVTSFQLLRPRDNHFLLRMRSDLLDIAARTFGKYVVFSKAQLSIADDMLGIGLRGQHVAQLLGNMTAQPLPGLRNGVTLYADGVLIQRDDSGIWFEYWGSSAAVAALWEQCQGKCSATGTRYWHWLNIRAGIGEICAATTEMFLPHMLNYHLTGAINFKKGCYTGQEIVARTHYRGQVKRHLVRAAVLGSTPTIGADIVDGNGNGNGKTLGNVVDRVQIDAQNTEILAVINGEIASTGSTKLHGGEVYLQMLELPYAIP